MTTAAHRKQAITSWQEHVKLITEALAEGRRKHYRNRSAMTLSNAAAAANAISEKRAGGVSPRPSPIHCHTNRILSDDSSKWLRAAK
jgi:hypothetical protein